MEAQVKIEDILKEMRETIGQQAQEIAILKATLEAQNSKEYKAEYEKPTITGIQRTSNPQPKGAK